ncbi:MAG: sugar ABC transporter permease [Anaerolineae bacterium]|nr:sugar ABC transporter permease [Anaerolineae bacterium]
MRTAIVGPMRGAPAAGRQSPSRRLRENLRGYAFVLPWIISLLVFTAYPMLASFYFAMTDYSVLNPPVWTGLQNFRVMFTKDPLYWKSVYNSAYYALLAVPLQMIVALGLALMLNQKVRGIGVYRTVYYLPSLMPTVAGTLLWMLILNPRHGLLNLGLHALGLPKLGWLSSAAWSKPGLVLMAVWTGSGWIMLIFLAALKEIPESLHEAAMIDGANAWQRFFAVTLPLLTPAIFFNLVMEIIGSFQVFASALIAGGSGQTAGPLNSLLMYMLHLYRYAFRYFDMGYASAMALALFAFLVVITMALVRSSGSWVYYETARR